MLLPITYQILKVSVFDSLPRTDLLLSTGFLGSNANKWKELWLISLKAKFRSNRVRWGQNSQLRENDAEREEKRKGKIRIGCARKIVGFF